MAGVPKDALRLRGRLAATSTCNPRGSLNSAAAAFTGQTGGYHTEVPEDKCHYCGCLTNRTVSHSLLDISERSQLPFKVIADAAADLERVGLLAPAD